MQQPSESKLSDIQLIKLVSRSINTEIGGWALFSNGTHIFVENDGVSEIKHQAVSILKEHGPVHPGSPSGDFSVTNLRDMEGWIVSTGPENMFVYVHPTEIGASGVTEPTHLEIGLLGRKKRELDAETLHIIHVKS